MVPVLKSKAVYGHIDGTDPCPPFGSPNFEAWMQIDYQILSWIQATISTEVLQMIIQPGRSLSAKEAWDAIHTAYHNQLAAQTLFLQQEYSSMRKQPGQSMLSYLQHVKGLIDKLHGVGHPKTDCDLVFQVLAGLDSEYSVAKRTITQRNPFPSFLELHSLLLIEEATLLREAANRHQLVISPSNPQLLHLLHHPQTPVVPSAASWDTSSGNHHQLYSLTTSTRGGRWSGRRGGRGSFRSTRGRSYGGSRHPSFSPNHQARDCPLLTIRPTTASTSTHQSLVASTSTSDPNWYIDSGHQDEERPPSLQ
ncbi:hypothetical protein SLEP1_g14875 [Rubroshorea leprosula]|uniref:UBN2_3 domain-containing protein n=1 Tax=Rubroshorea leprosula TaxID=152421 RepID=A0AAV5IWC1_9ROSI|nr:hypothetical protein SLEP1_g14875 [Rubroshorea leprosula]